MPKKATTQKPSSITYKTQIHALEHLKGQYIEVPEKVIEHFGGTFKVRWVCTLNDKLSFQTGPVAMGNGGGYINLSAARMKKLGLKLRDEVSVMLELDESKYGFDMPEELKELLKQDKEGMRRFKLLVPGKQRYIIYYVSQVKSSQSRVERAVRLINNLKNTREGKESFKELLAN